MGAPLLRLSNLRQNHGANREEARKLGSSVDQIRPRKSQQLGYQVPEPRYTKAKLNQESIGEGSWYQEKL